MIHDKKVDEDWMLTDCLHADEPIRENFLQDFWNVSEFQDIL